MFRYILALALFACIATSCGSNTAVQLDNSAVRAASSVDATNAWNSVCGQYNFIPKPFDTRITFAMGYYGTNLNADLAAAVSAVNSIMSVQQPTTGSDVMSVQQPTTGSDVMKIKIENWN
jgi:hypothetical protein